MIRIRPDQSPTSGTQWHVVVLPYGGPLAVVNVAVVPVQTANGQDDATVAGIASPPASAREAADMMPCENCGERVPAARHSLHVAYCTRHNTRCGVCGRVLRKVLMNESNGQQ